jgi:hypothetical protein
VCVCACVRVCVRVCVRARVCACACVCPSNKERRLCIHITQNTLPFPTTSYHIRNVCCVLTRYSKAMQPMRVCTLYLSTHKYIQNVAKSSYMICFISSSWKTTRKNPQIGHSRYLSRLFKFIVCNNHSI